MIAGKTKPLKFVVISWILIFQFALSYPLSICAATPPPSGTETQDQIPVNYTGGGIPPILEAAGIVGSIEQAKRDGTTIPVPLPKDNFRFKHQFRQYMEPCTDDPSKDCIKEEIWLVQPTLKLDKVYFQSVADEFRVVRQPNELWLEHVIFDQKLGRVRVTDRHVIRNLTLTNTDGRPVEMDELFGLFATEQGLHSFITPQMIELFGIAPIPIFEVTSPPPFEGARIAQVELLDYEKTHRTFEGGITPKIGDIALTVTRPGSEGNTLTENVVISQNEVLIRARIALVALLAEISVENLDPELISIIQQILAEDLKDEKAFEKMRRQIVDHHPDDTVTKRAVTVFAQRVNLPKLAQLARKDAGDLAALTVVPRENMRAARWQRHNATIATARSTNDIGAQLPWSEILRRAHKNPDGWVKDLITEAQKRQDDAALTKFQRALAASKKIVTPKRLLVLAAILAGTIGLDVTHHQQWLISAFSYFFHWTTQVPLLKNLTQDIADSSDYFTGAWALTRVMIGMGLVALVLPASLLLAKGAATITKKSGDAVTAFFLLMAQLYSRVIPPVQQLMWERLGNQRNLYPTIRNGLNPFTTPGAFNARDATPNELAANAKRVQNTIENDATRKTRSLLIAAALVSERTHIDPVTLISLLNAGSDDRFSYLMRSLTNVEAQKQFQHYAETVYRALAKLGDEGFGPVNEETVLAYHEVFSRFAEEIRDLESSPQNKSTAIFLHRRGDEIRRLFSRNILPFVLFGQQSIEQAQKWRHQTPRPEDIRTANGQYGADYLASDVAYGLAAPKLFAAVATGDIQGGAAEIWGNQLGQPFLYGFSVVDIGNGRANKALALRMPLRYMPIARTLFAGDLHREQTFLQGLKALAKKTFDPNARSMFDMARSYWTSNMTGFQGRFAVGSLVRAMAFGIKGKSVIDAFPAEAFFLGTKYAVVMRSSGIQVGYTLLAWPIVTHGEDALTDAALENRERVQSAVDILYDGIVSDDLDAVRDGAAAMQTLYAEGHEALPPHLMVPSHRYTLELGQQLMDHLTGTLGTHNHVPIPTAPSQLWVKWILTVGVGTGVTSILFNQTSNVVYAKDFNAWLELARAIPWNAATVAALAILPKVTKAGLTILQPIVQPVGAVLADHVIDPLDRGIQTTLQACGRALSRRSLASKAK